MLRSKKSAYAKWADWVVLLLILVGLFAMLKLAYYSSPSAKSTPISLGMRYIPYYAWRSVFRMIMAYLLSIIFSITYGYAAARSKLNEKIMLPILDILQSVPIFAFLPVFVFSLRAFIPQGLALEIASILLIFTSQVWNMTFAWYQSLTTIPKELKEASNIFLLNSWMRFKKLELPFGFVSLVWNSIMSWAGGWFFLIAAEIFTVGNKNFELVGLGSYMQEATYQGNIKALLIGIITLIIIIVLLDQLVWRPLLSWAKKFNLEMVSAGADAETVSWFYPVLRQSKIVLWFEATVLKPMVAAMDKYFNKRLSRKKVVVVNVDKPVNKKVLIVIAMILGLVLLFGAQRMIAFMSTVKAGDYLHILEAAFATMSRVFVALSLSLLWTIPVGVLIGSNKKAALVLQPLVQIAASVPATAFFPILILFFIKLPFGINIAAIVLMILGTQWYLLFNVIAGVSTIPQDLRYTASLMRLKKWNYWKTLILPALFPFIITGSITASGGAWNASVIAEYVTTNEKTYSTIGLGSIIADATAKSNYPMLFAAAFVMIVFVTCINRFGWRRLYALAKEKYKME
ncbi:MAG TPA: ABC transporter permease subunit [Bacteroidia bacterium]|jgi:NitT/TauT family transport system permease protein|nr:ABC transporter permease subunit [Bacteroidia bacterium]